MASIKDLKIARYRHPQGMEGLVKVYDKNGKWTGEYREADPEGWYRKLQVKGKGKKKKSKKG
tara:strand:+ start:1205 stop:1390 length:186 start_codon:yes stop_codon:yes gene_type:complete